MITPLNYTGYEDYLKHKNRMTAQVGGYDYLFFFPNGLGVSVIKHYGSYGFENDLFEIAPIMHPIDDSKDWFDWFHIEEITGDDDIKGYLTNDEVIEILEKVKNWYGGKRND